MPTPNKARSRVVFMGTPHFAVPTLRRLLPTHDVVAVFAQPDRPAGRGRGVVRGPVAALADAAHVPVHQPARLRRGPEADAAKAALAALDPDVLVVAAYGLILPADVLAMARFGALNVHGSLLPRWRGAAPVQAAVMAGDAQTGVSIMLLDEGLDTGPVLARRAVAIGAEETAGQLSARLAELGGALLAETLPRWTAGAIRPDAQDEALATYAPKLTKSEGALAWDAAAEALVRQVRGLDPWPGAYLTLPDGSRVKVLAARTIDAPAAPQGTLRLIEGEPAVATAEGWLRLERVQPEGRGPMAGAAFLRGRAEIEGAVLLAPAAAPSL